MPEEIDPRRPPPSRGSSDDPGTERIDPNWGPPRPQDFEPWPPPPPGGNPAMTAPPDRPVIGPPTEAWWRSGRLWLAFVTGIVVGAAATFAAMTLYRGAANQSGTSQQATGGTAHIATKSGKTHCAITQDSVTCEGQFTNSPTVNGQQANDVQVLSSGSLQWMPGNIGAPPDTVTLDYQTYHVQGWTIAADITGTRFTNDRTGHGMFVSIDNVTAF